METRQDRGRVRALLLAAAKQRASQALTLTRTDNQEQQQHQQTHEAALFAPYSPSPASVIDAVWTHLKSQQLSLANDELLVDLGCGDGRWLISGVQQFGCRALGIELDPALAQAATDSVMASGLQQQIEIVEGDIMKMPLHDARLVIVYAFAESLHGIREYLSEQLSSSAMVLSIGFRVPDWKPQWTERVTGLRWYLYDMSAVSHPKKKTQVSTSKKTGAAEPDAA